MALHWVTRLRGGHSWKCQGAGIRTSAVEAATIAGAARGTTAIAAVAAAAIATTAVPAALRPQPNASTCAQGSMARMHAVGECRAGRWPPPGLRAMTVAGAVGGGECAAHPGQRAAAVAVARAGAGAPASGPGPGPGLPPPALPPDSPLLRLTHSSRLNSTVKNQGAPDLATPYLACVRWPHAHLPASQAGIRKGITQSAGRPHRS